jgi:tetratricopeptide (TPR) repeat protein
MSAKGRVVGQGGLGEPLCGTNLFVAGSHMADHNRIPPTQRLRRAWSPLVGRTDELRHLEACWSRARAGQGNAVVISGEVGIGKSRLALELEKHAQADDALCLRLQCSALQSNTHLHPIQEHLANIAGVRPTEPLSLRADKIQKMIMLAVSDQPLERLISGLVAIGAPADPDGDVRGSQSRREVLLEALNAGLTDVTALKPLLYILEDAQWLDPTSNDLLERLVRRVSRFRLLVVVTGRREYDPSWIGAPHTSVVIPRRLNAADSLMLAQQIAGIDTFSAGDLQSVIDRSEGVPLFVEELSKAMPGDGAIAPDGLKVPATLVALMMARLDTLGPAKEIAQIAAALGRRFSHSIAARVWGGRDAEFNALISDLMVAEFVLPKPIVQGAHYTFRHALLQEAAYASLEGEQCALVHAKIADVLAADQQDMMIHQPEIMAHHHERAELHQWAARDWLAAGKASAARGGVEEAINCFKLGLGSIMRGARTEQLKRLEFELNMNLGPALMALKGYASEDGLSAFAHARRLLGLSRSSLEEIHVLLGLFNVHFGRGEFQQALDVGQQADQHLTVGYGGYPVLMGQAQCMMGDFVEARRSLERALERYDPALDVNSGLFCNADVVATSFLAKVEFSLGNLDRSAELTRVTMDLARQQGHPLALAIAYLGQLFLAAEMGDLEQAQKIADDALAHVTQHNLGNFRLWVAFHRAALSLRSNPAAAIATMHQILDEADAAGTLMFRSAQLGLLGAAYASTGRKDEALAAIEQGLATARKTRGLEAVPALYRLRAKILLEARPAEALRDLEASLALARSQSARIEELRSATVLARALKGTDREGYGRDLLAVVYEAFRRGHPFPDLQHAGRVLASLGGAA